MTALLAAVVRFLTGIVEIIDRHMDDLSHQWGWR